MNPESQAKTPLPSATVVVIRDGEQQLEVLLLERNRSKSPWVFPGGKVDAADRAAAPDDADAGFRRAAVREAREEASLELREAELIPISRWITPELAPRRFDTWFFLARVERDVEIRVDGSEMRSHRWLVPEVALEAHHRREIRLAPPTFVTVSWLAGHAETDAALEVLSENEVLTFRPRICAVSDGACILYPGDAGYDEGDVERPGPRHRLWSLPDGWRYERG